MYTPVNPSFTIWKWGLRGSKLYRYVFVMTMSGWFSTLILTYLCLTVHTCVSSWTYTFSSNVISKTSIEAISTIKTRICITNLSLVGASEIDILLIKPPVVNMYPDKALSSTRAEEIPRLTCPTCPTSLRTSKAFQFTCPGARTSWL